jgi:hypothetical protein
MSASDHRITVEVVADQRRWKDAVRGEHEGKVAGPQQRVGHEHEAEGDAKRRQAADIDREPALHGAMHALPEDGRDPGHAVGHGRRLRGGVS